MRKFGLLSIAAFLAACSDVSTTTTPRVATATRAASAPEAIATGGVFIETNAADGNAIVAFARAVDGTLTPTGTYSTGGLGIGGTADPLASQFAVALSPDHQFLYAVNAGSNSVAAFAVSGGKLRAVGVVASNGVRPVSIAVGQGIAYVLNAGSNNVAGYRIATDGSLIAVPEWTRALSAGAAGAAQVEFTPDERVLIVTERASSSIDTYLVGTDGSLGNAIANASSGAAPFGFDVTPRGQIVVSEAAARATSSYAVQSDGTLSVITASAPTLNIAPCWTIVTGDGRFAYIANAGSATLTGYGIAADGALSILGQAGVSGRLPDGSTPLDIDVSRDSRYVYVLEAGSGKIAFFTVGNDGALTLDGEVAAVAPRSGQMGIAAY